LATLSNTNHSDAASRQAARRHQKEREGLAAESVYTDDATTTEGSWMPRLLKPVVRQPGARDVLVLLAGVLAIAASALAGIALAKSFTLHIASDAKVMNAGTGMTTHEAIAVNSRGRAVYGLSGDSKKHPKCTSGNGCFAFWPPLKVASPKKLSKQPGIKGKLGVWRRGGFLQVTLAGHPLYTYAGDSQRRVANGEGIHTFGGTWHVIKTSSTKATTPTTTTTPMTTMPTTTTSTTTTPTTTTTPPYPY
jgi:predicted lipoprotein with Yx(FWY)xxD motif